MKYYDSGYIYDPQTGQKKKVHGLAASKDMKTKKGGIGYLVDTIIDAGTIFFTGTNVKGHKLAEMDAENERRRQRNSRRESEFAEHVQSEVNKRNQAKERFTPVDNYNSRIYER